MPSHNNRDEWAGRAQKRRVMGWAAFILVVLGLGSFALDGVINVIADGGDSSLPGTGWLLGIGVLALLISVVPGWYWSNLRGGSNGPF